MTGRERVAAALQGLPTDRRAVAPVLSLYGARLTGYAARDYYTDPEAYVLGQTAVWNLLQPDVLFAPFCLAIEGAAFGGREHFLDRHPPNLAEFAISGPEQLSSLEVPDPATHPRLLYVRHALRLLRRRYGTDAMLCATCLSPLDSPALVMGLENWLQTILFDTAGQRAVLERTVPFFVAWANALLADGADFLALPLAFCNPAVVTADWVRRVARPVLHEAFAQVQGALVIHHTGAPLGPFLPLLKGLPNVVGFALDAGDSLAEARTVLGPGPLLLGNLAGPPLLHQTPQQVAERCREILEETWGDRCFVLATSGADVAFDTPPANLLALHEAAVAWGIGTAATADPRAAAGTVVVACSIFRPRLLAAQQSGACPWPVRFLDSSLHMEPNELRRQLRSVVAWERAQGHRVLVVYGDCHAHLVEDCAGPGVARVVGTNCCQLLLGAKRNRQLLREGAFIFLPEWVERWREMLEKAFGMDREGVRAAMGEVHRKLVFLEVEGESVPTETMAGIGEYLGLPWEREQVDGRHLAAALADAARRLDDTVRACGP